MKLLRVLVVYYSRTNTTRTLAMAIRDALDCVIDRILDRTTREGAFGYLRSAIDVTFHRRAEIRSLTTDADDYDLVIVGTPVWAASVSAPVRTYLEENAARFRKVAFFCTYGGQGCERALRQMEEICGRAPLATLAVRADDVAIEDELAERVGAFVKSLGLTSAREGIPVAPRPDVWKRRARWTRDRRGHLRGTRHPS